MNKPRVVAVIQARMNSTRLPGKVLLPLGPNNKSVLWWCVKRASLAKLVDQVVVATTSNLANKPIYKELWNIWQNCSLNEDLCEYFEYDGNENDVIDRVIGCAKKYEADIIVDITGDCPMVDPRHIDELIRVLKFAHLYDYVSNDIDCRSWPDGLDCQVYWFDALMKCKRLLNPKQHCGWNIAQWPSIFDIRHYSAPLEYCWPDLGLTLDTEQDYQLLSRLFDKFGNDPAFKVEDVIDFLRVNPDWITNKDVRRKAPEEG